MKPRHAQIGVQFRFVLWVQQQEQFILHHSHAGVTRPEAVRILGVPEIPLPEADDLRQAAVAFGLITPDTNGLTISHGIFVRQDCVNDPKLIAAS